MNPAAILPFFSTLAGGYAALRLRHRLHVLMALAAGVVVATAVVDLLPEAFALAGPGAALQIGLATVVGFIGFSFLEAFLHQSSFEHGGTRGHDHRDEVEHGHTAEHVAEPAAVVAEPTSGGRGLIGLLPPMSLVIHSAMDGLMIGFAFQASEAVGVVVLFAVLAHDFADGMNVVTLALDAARGHRVAVIFVLLDAIAAPIGAGLSTLLRIDDVTLGLLLAGFGGVFLAIGAGHLLPESQHRDPRHGPAFVALAGLGAAIVLAVRALVPEV